MKKATKKEIQEIHQLFIDRYSDAVTELEYKNAYELVVAVALSAQCTDKRVNIITPQLFLKYPHPHAMAQADINEVKALINSCSFFNNKAKNIIEMAKRVVDVYGGEIPMNEKELMTLGGVGQKTANVVMIEYTGANLMAVDTHVLGFHTDLDSVMIKLQSKQKQRLLKSLKTTFMPCIKEWYSLVAISVPLKIQSAKSVF